MDSRSHNPRGLRICDECGVAASAGDVACAFCGSTLKRQPLEVPNNVSRPRSKKKDSPLSDECPRCSAEIGSAEEYCHNCGLFFEALNGPAQARLYSVDFSARLVARSIDLSVLALITGMLFIGQIWAVNYVASQFHLIINQATISLILAFYIAVPAFVAVCYFVLTTGTYGLTLGKAAKGLKVVCKDGGKPGYIRSLWRLIVEVLLLVFIVDYLAGILGKQKRTLHDILSGTWVVSR